MKSKNVLFVSLLFLILHVNSQTTVKSFKEAQALSLSTNKPIFLITKNFNNFSKYISTYKYINNPEVRKGLINFVVLELQDQTSDYRYLLFLNKNSYSLGGNVLDPMGNVIGFFSVKGPSRKTNKTQLDFVIENLIRNSFDLSPLKEEYKAIIKNNDVHARINLIEKYLNYSLNTSFFRYKKQKRSPLFSYVAGRYSKELKKEIKSNNALKESDQQRLELLDLYKIVIDEKYNRAAKKLQKMSSNSISDSNKSLFYYLSYVSNLKAKKETVAKEWFDKLKEQKDFDHYFLLSRKI